MGNGIWLPYFAFFWFLISVVTFSHVCWPFRFPILWLVPVSILYLFLNLVINTIIINFRNYCIYSADQSFFRYVCCQYLFLVRSLCCVEVFVNVKYINNFLYNVCNLCLVWRLLYYNQIVKIYYLSSVKKFCFLHFDF